jgi:hypothetical protein
MSENQSVTWWLENLKEGDEAAAQFLWRRYFQRLAGLARQRLSEGQRRVQDEDDIALSVERKFERIRELWKGELAS